MGIEAVIVELDWLIAHGYITSYAIGGAVGAFQYLEPAFTEDLDVFVVFSGPDANSLAPLGPLWGALTQRGATVDDMYLVIGGWRVQFLAPGSELFEEAIAHARDMPLGRSTGKVMTPEYLAATSLHAGRGKDYVRVDEFLTRKIVDKSQLLALVERFGLTERWKTFEQKFLIANA